MVRAMLNAIAITVTANIIAKMFTMMGSSGMGSSSIARWVSFVTTQCMRTRLKYF